MQPALLALIITSVAMSACAQLLLKMGVGTAQTGATSGVAAGLTYLASPWVVGGLALYGLGAVVWLYVLARLPLSAAYPFVGLGFVLTMGLGALALGESLTLTRIAGTALIALGCALVSRSIA